jgi:hypothetical protein
MQKGWKNKRRSGSKEIPKKITPKSKIWISQTIFLNL